MDFEGGLLRPEDHAVIDSYDRDEDTDFVDMLEAVLRIIMEGVQEGRFTEAEVWNDLEIVLLIAYICNNLDNYEHYVETCNRLAQVEDKAHGCGDWFYRYAVALLYTGKVTKAMDVLLRGVDEDPSNPWCWMMLARMRSHYGNVESALQAADKARSLCPDDPEILALHDQIRAGCPLEVMEFGCGIDVDVDEIEDIYWSAENEDHPRAGAVMGILVDQDRLTFLKEKLNLSGFIANSPYCTCMVETDVGPLMVSFDMNDAFLSKVPPEAIIDIIFSVGIMEDIARDSKSDIEDRPLTCISIDRRLRPTLSFGGLRGDDVVTVRFNEDFEIDEGTKIWGPFGSIVLLGTDDWDPGLVVSNLRSEWGINIDPEIDGDSMTFGLSDNLVTMRCIHHPIPDDDAEQMALRNYFWAEGPEVVSFHKAHVVIALFNQGGTPIGAATLHTQLTSTVVKSFHCLGVCFDETIMRPDDYMRIADRIHEGELPVEDWFWVTMYRSDDGTSAYTGGLELFGYEELEVIESTMDPSQLRELLYQISFFMIDNNVTFRDFDSLTFENFGTVHIQRMEGFLIEGIALRVFPLGEEPE